MIFSTYQFEILVLSRFGINITNNIYVQKENPGQMNALGFLLLFFPIFKQCRASLFTCIAAFLPAKLFPVPF